MGSRTTHQIVEEDFCGEITTQHHQHQHDDHRYLPPRIPRRRASVEIHFDDNMLLLNGDGDEQQELQHDESEEEHELEEEQEHSSCDQSSRPILVKEGRYNNKTKTITRQETPLLESHHNPIQGTQHRSPICVVDTRNIEEEEKVHHSPTLQQPQLHGSSLELELQKTSVTGDVVKEIIVWDNDRGSRTSRSSDLLLPGKEEGEKVEKKERESRQQEWQNKLTGQIESAIEIVSTSLDV